MSNTKASSANVMQLRPAVLISPIVGLVIALYWPTFGQLWRFWETDQNYGHGFLVPIASAFLIWRVRQRLRELPIESYAPPAVFLVGALLLHVAGFRGAILCASALSFVLVLTWILLLFLGKAFVREIGFALFFLLFMIPIPMLDRLSFPLKMLATRMSVPLVTGLGIPVYREGTVLFLPGFTMEIATACSGLKALVLVTAVGTLYAYMTLDTLGKRAALVATCVPIALVANVGRIVIIAILSLRLSTESLFHLVHDYSGLPVYVIAGALLALAGGGIEWLSRRKRT